MGSIKENKKKSDTSYLIIAAYMYLWTETSSYCVGWWRLCLNWPQWTAIAGSLIQNEYYKLQGYAEMNLTACEHWPEIFGQNEFYLMEDQAKMTFTICSSRPQLLSSWKSGPEWTFLLHVSSPSRITILPLYFFWAVKYFVRTLTIRSRCLPQFCRGKNILI